MDCICGKPTNVFCKDKCLSCWELTERLKVRENIEICIAKLKQTEKEKLQWERD